MLAHFENMATMGKKLTDKARARTQENADIVHEVEQQIHRPVEELLQADGVLGFVRFGHHLKGASHRSIGVVAQSAIP